jgi:hypothetical protein
MAWSSQAAREVASQPTDHSRVRPPEPLIAVQHEEQHHARASIAEAPDEFTQSARSRNGGRGPLATLTQTRINPRCV